MRIGARIWVAALALASVACGDDEANVDDDDGGTGGSVSASNGSGGAMASSTTSTGQGPGGGGQGGDQAAAEMCARWNADRADMSEGSWSGAVGTCDAGDTSMVGRDNALRVVNLYRWLTDLPPVAHDPTRNAKAQECALMMHANSDLDHNPPMGWTCWNGDGDEAAGKSNIATTPGVRAVDLYMGDHGNATTMGHRRWILNNELGPIGLGSTDSYSCMWVIGGNGSASREWTAFPSDGVWPIEAMTASFVPVDETGWTIQSDTINLDGANVAISEDGIDKPVTVEVLLPNYGSKQALRLVPNGWTSRAGSVYEVSVTGVDQPFSYQVEMVACED